MPNTSISKTLTTLPQSVRQVAEARILEIHEFQRAFGMEPRDDSTLTLSYATGKMPHMTSLQIAKELVIVDRVYQHTQYSSVLEEVMRKVTYYLKEKYSFISWTDIWSITRFYIPEMIKLYCIRMSGKSHQIMQFS